MSLARALGLLVLIVLIAHLLMRHDGSTLRKVQPGLGLFIQLSLPPLLFKALFEINLVGDEIQRDWALIGGICLAKIIMWFIGFMLGMLIYRGDFGIAGLYAMFMTLGNDIAFGVPLMKGLFPTQHKYVNYDLLMCNVSEVFFNPLSYFCFEIYNAQKTRRQKALQGEEDSGGFQWYRIVRNVFEEPMVVFALLGLLCNLVFNLGLGLCKFPMMPSSSMDSFGSCLDKSKCMLPEFLDMVCVTFENAFNLLALLSLGLQLYGKTSKSPR